MKETIGLCVIARNEEKNIARCIESVRGLVDEIVVVDTGSTDKTIEIARKLGARVYMYKWDDNFSNAKNFAIGRARSRWLLLLDADEELDRSAWEPLREFVETTDLTGRTCACATTRARIPGPLQPPQCAQAPTQQRQIQIYRRHPRADFARRLHEARKPLCRIRPRRPPLRVLGRGRGREEQAPRNLPILRRCSRKTDDAFTLFNLGNEYLSSGDMEKALGYYARAKENARDLTFAFVPHLYFRMANTLDAMGRQGEALQVLEEGLKIYPRCTDFEFVRGNIFLRQRRYTLAIESFEKCLRLGRPPAALEFLDGCGTYRPAYLLGDIYARFEDWQRALQYYSKVLQLNPAMTGTLFRACHALNKIHADKSRVREELFRFFADPSYPPNILAAAEILITEELYAEAIEALRTLPPSHGHDVKEKLLYARAYAYLGERERARQAAYDALRTDAEGARALASHILLVLALSGGSAAEMGVALER